MILGQHTNIKSTSIPTLKTKSISINPPKPSNFKPAQKQSQFWPPHKNQVNLDTHTKTKSISIPYTKTKFISTHHWDKVYFDSHSDIKLISMPRGENRVSFATNTKDRSFWTAAQNQVDSDPHTKIKSIATTHTTTKSISLGHKSSLPPPLKSSQFRPPTPKESQFRAHTRTKRFAARVQNQANFDHPHKDQVNTDGHSTTK